MSDIVERAGRWLKTAYGDEEVVDAHDILDELVEDLRQARTEIQTLKGLLETQGRERGWKIAEDLRREVASRHRMDQLVEEQAKGLLDIPVKYGEPRAVSDNGEHGKVSEYIQQLPSPFAGVDRTVPTPIAKEQIDEAIDLIATNGEASASSTRYWADYRPVKDSEIVYVESYYKGERHTICAEVRVVERWRLPAHEHGKESATMKAKPVTPRLIVGCQGDWDGDV